MPATVLIVTDVFGNTPAIASLQRHLGLQSLVVSPLNVPYSATTEQQAYQAFLASGGVQAFAKKLKAIVQDQPQLQHVIAFSAGASAWWLASAEHPHPLHSITLFYGSRIRDHIDTKSHRNTHLVFAEHENAFQPKLVVNALRQRGYLAEIAVGSKHGFMNPYSAGFHLKIQTHYLEVLARKMEIQECLAFGT